MPVSKLPNPWEGQRGFWSAVNRFFYPIAGPAAVGIGRPEAPYVPPADPRCPMCGELMAAHEIERGVGTKSTRLHCPPAAV